MENITWEKIALAISAVFGALVVGVPVFQMLYTWVDNNRKARREKSLQHLSHTAQLQELSIKEGTRRDELLLKIIEERNKECDKLKAEIEILEKSYSLPRPVMTKINVAMRQTYLQIGNVRNLVQQKEKEANILIEIDILDQKLDEVSNLLQ